MSSCTLFPTAHKFAVVAIAATTISTQADARIGQICLDLPAGASMVQVEIASGCLSSGRNYDAAFDISVDGKRALISIEGEFRTDDSFRMGTTDCMASRVVEQEAEAAGPRRYSVLINGEYRGVIDASDTLFGMFPVRQCFAGGSQRQRPQTAVQAIYVRNQFDNWIEQPISELNTQPHQNDFTSLGELAAALQSGHPDTLEGRPSVEVSLSPGRWGRFGVGVADEDNFMAIRIEEHGYTDDSVSGMPVFATARQNHQTRTWKAIDRWHQYMCARGPRAGQWTAEPCE